MATALEHSKTSKSLYLSCTLCNDESKKPKLLPCQHSFCTPCLVQHQETLDEGKPFCCPSCHKDIKLRDDAVESLPDNYVYDIVKEAFGGIKPSEIKCISCTQIEKTTNATHKCLDCGDTLCKHCNEWHCRTTMTKHHVVVRMEDLEKGKFKEELSMRKILYCVIHSSDEKNVPLSSYCDDCECLVCVTCTHSDHKGHEFKELHEVREEREDPISKICINLQRSEKDQQKRVRNIKDCIDNTKQTWNEQETEIYHKATDIHAMVDKIKDEKLAELKSHYEEELQRLNDLLDEEKHKQSSLQATVALSGEFLEHSTDSDFLYHEKDVKARMEASQRRENPYYERNILNMEKGELDTLMPVIENVFGRMVQKERCVQHKCRIGEICTKFSRKVNMTNIYGIAFNANTKEYLLSGDSNHRYLLVLNDNGTLIKYIECTEGDNSFDISIQRSTIFVTFYPKYSRRMCEIDANGTIKRTIKLPNDDQDRDYVIGLAVDKDNTVFVASNTKHRIYRMGPDEDTLSIFLSKANGFNISGPIYLCVMSSGELVVSNDVSSSIQVYSKKGDLLWEYDGKKQDSPLRTPSGICCDEEGYIYVVDSKNCRIQVIRDKELIGIIPIDEQVKRANYVPLLITPEGDLVYGFEDNLVKITFWEH